MCRRLNSGIVEQLLRLLFPNCNNPWIEEIPNVSLAHTHTSQVRKTSEFSRRRAAAVASRHIPVMDNSFLSEIWYSLFLHRTVIADAQRREGSNLDVVHWCCPAYTRVCMRCYVHCVHKKDASSFFVITSIWLFWYLLSFVHELRWRKFSSQVSIYTRQKFHQLSN